MEKLDTENAIRKCFQAYRTGDRALAESVIADGFHFSSPQDDRIDRKRYFERCWPASEALEEFEIEELFARGSEAFVRYTARRKKDGTRFRNTEFHRVENGKLVEVEVYFGRDLSGHALS